MNFILSTMVGVLWYASSIWINQPFTFYQTIISIILFCGLMHLNDIKELIDDIKDKE